MIQLRRTLERGRAHPILGPILLVLLVLLLAMTFLHAAHDNEHIALDAGAICLGIATFLGLLVLQRPRSHAPTAVIAVRGDRGPPVATRLRVARPGAAAALPLFLRLRR